MRDIGAEVVEVTKEAFDSGVMGGFLGGSHHFTSLQKARFFLRNVYEIEVKMKPCLDEGDGSQPTGPIRRD